MGRKRKQQEIADAELQEIIDNFNVSSDDLSENSSYGYGMYDDFDDDDSSSRGMFDWMDDYYSDHDELYDGPTDPILVERNCIAENYLPADKNIKKRILDSLELSEVNGEWFSGGKLDSNYLMPAIELLNEEGAVYRPLALPIIYEEQVKELINCSIKNNGERKTWLIEPQKFRITNTNWDSMMNELVNRIKPQLGILKEKKIEISLYRLMLNAEGGSFDFKLDTEPGMLGSLVVQLPNLFVGGDFVMNSTSDDKTEKKFEFQKEAAYSPYYITFYDHDFKQKSEPISSGYRLSMIYSLKYSGSDKIIPYNSATQLKDLQQVIETWIKTPMYSKLCYVLEQEYDFNNLSIVPKGNDEVTFQQLSKLDHVVVQLGFLDKQEVSRFCDYDTCTTDLVYKVCINTDKTLLNYSVNEEEVFPENRRKEMKLNSTRKSEHEFGDIKVERHYKRACIFIYPKQFKSLLEPKKDQLSKLISDCKEKKTDKRKHLLIAYTSSLLGCSEDRKGESTAFLDIAKTLEACILVNYLPLSLKFVEKLWLSDAFKENVTTVTKLIKHHHGGTGFNELFNHYLEKTKFNSITVSDEMFAIGTMILELEETAWIEPMIQKLLLPSNQLIWLEPKTVLQILNIKEKYPTVATEKIAQFIQLYIQAEMNNCAFSSCESKLNAEVIIKLNDSQLFGVLVNRLVHSKYQLNFSILQEALLKHFGIKGDTEILLNAIVEDMMAYPLQQRIDAYTQLASGESAESKIFSNKILTTIVRKFDTTGDPTDDCAKLLTFCRKNDKITEEVNIANLLIEKITKAKHAHSLIQQLIKDNGTECF